MDGKRRPQRNQSKAITVELTSGSAAFTITFCTANSIEDHVFKTMTQTEKEIAVTEAGIRASNCTDSSVLVLSLEAKC